MTKTKSLIVTFLVYLLASLASTTHQPNRRQPDSGSGGGDGDDDLSHFVYPYWSVLNFDGTCSPGGCRLAFNLSSTATASEPAISAACTINGDNSTWQRCATLVSIAATGGESSREDEACEGGDAGGDSSIWALPLPAVDLFAVSVQHRFSNASLTPTRYYNVTGNMTVDFEDVTLPVNLTVMGTTVSETWSWTIRH